MSRWRWLPLAWCCFASAMVCLPAAHGQTAPAPHSLVGVLIDFQTRGNALVGVPPNSPIGDISLLASLAALEASTAPYGTSSGGLTFTFDPQLGAWVRSARSFGPAFAERSLTIGRGKLSAGMNGLFSRYSSMAGKDLDNGELRPVRNARAPVPSAIPEYSTLTLRLASDVFVVFANYGLTNNVDVGLVIPSIRYSLEGQVGIFLGTIDVTGGAVRIPKTTAAGVGDIALRAKVRLVPAEQGGVAMLVEVALPTGAKDDFRGLGLTRTLVSGIWSRAGRFSPHVNIGYEFWSDRSPVTTTSGVFVKDQLKYAFGLEFDANPRATFLLDLVGRRLLNGGRAGYQTLVGLVGPGSSLEALVAVPEGLNVISMAPGIKWNVWGSLLVTGNVLISVENEGLRAGVVPVVGVDWAF